MGYCYPKKQKDIQVYTKMNNNSVLEIPEPKQKMKQDYESVKNQVMESNSKVLEIKENKKTKKYIIN